MQLQRDAAQGEGLVVAGMEEPVQVDRVDDRVGVVTGALRAPTSRHVSESLTIRHGSTLSAPFAPESVHRDDGSVVEELVALDRQQRLLAGHRVRRATDLVGGEHAGPGRAGDRLDVDQCERRIGRDVGRVRWR